MGLYIIAAECRRDVLVFVQHHVKNKVDFYEFADLVDVASHRIGVEPAGGGVLVEHVRVVDADGPEAGDAWHDGLGAA